MAGTQGNRFIAVTTPFGEDELLFRRMTVNESLGRLLEVHLELLCTHEDIDLEKVVGENFTVRM